MNSQVALHISPSAIRMMEGTLQKDRLVTGGHAIIENASIYFEDGKLTHLREMAKAIVDELQAQDIRTKNLSICYDHDITVEMLDTPIFTPQEKKSLFKKNKKNKNEASSLPNGVLEKAQDWGESVNFRNDQEIRTATSSLTRIDRDLSQGICYEFAELGYNVTSIEAPQSVLMYMRHANPYSYDSLAMLVIYLNSPDDMAWVYTFMKGVPRSAIKKHLAGSVGWSLADRVVSTCQKEATGNSLRRPTVILAGDAFANGEVYADVVDALEKEGFGVYDIYDNIRDLPDGASAVDMDNALHIEVDSPAKDDGAGDYVCGMYSICMALLLRMLDKKPDNLIDPKDKPSTKRAALATTKALLIAGIVCLICSVFALGYETVSWRLACKDLQSQEQVDARLQAAEAENKNSSQHLQAINVSDSRYVELLKFIREHISDDTINVASVDTDDMFSELSTNDSQYAAENITTEDGSESTDSSAAVEGKTISAMSSNATIVIRGYAKDSESIRKFYTMLANESNLGTARMVGIQCVTLESAIEDTIDAQKETTSSVTAANSTTTNTTDSETADFYAFMNSFTNVLQTAVNTITESGETGKETVTVASSTEEIYLFEIELI